MGEAEEVEVELIWVIGLEVAEFVAERDGSCSVARVRLVWDMMVVGWMYV